MTSIDDKYNNTYHRKIKMNGVNSSTYIDSDVENNEKHPEFKIGNH